MRRAIQDSNAGVNRVFWCGGRDEGKPHPINGSMWYDLELERGGSVTACLSQGSEMCSTKYFDESFLVGIYPGYRREPTGCLIHALGFILLENKGHNTSEEALDKVENIIDGRTYFADRLEDVTMEDHLPLNATFRRKEGARVHGKLELELGTSWKAD